MKLLNVILVLLFSVLLPVYLFAAPIKFFPAKLVQPDGDTINVFLTGDEYYNWVHDGDEYTIIQDQRTGYYVYADLLNGELVPTSFIVSRTDPKTTYLQARLNISPERMLERRKEFLRNSPSDMGMTPTTGTLNNLVVFIRFSGESEFTDLVSKYDNWFNNSTTGYNSMNNYFKEASYNTLTIPSTFYPVPAGSTVISYQDSHVRGYFQPYSTTNTIGYNGDTERRTREHTLLVDAVNYVSSQVPTSLNLDGDNDGKVDNVCFIVYGTTTAWSTLLWPHRWSLYTYTVNINGKRVYDYNFQLQTHMASSGVGVLCHEMFHSLGAPDLYHYTSNGITPVGSWDVMENNSNPPQHMGAHMKYKYGHWISSIPVITSGTFTLNPLTSSTGNCYRINSPNSSTDYYIVEYRRKTGPFESSIPGTGMLIYKINTLAGNGNADGPPDEVYIYRPNGTLTVNGTVSSANYSSTVGRTSINDNTNPAPFLSDGNPGGLNIHSISAGGETITFTVGLPQPPAAITNLTVINPNSGSLTLRWTVPAGITGYDARYSTLPIPDTNAFNSASVLSIGTIDPAGTLQSFVVSPLNFSTTYYFAIRTVNAAGVKSTMSNAASGTVWMAPAIFTFPSSIQKTLLPSVTASDTITISNTTTLPSSLDFTVTLQNSTLQNAAIQGRFVPVAETDEAKQGAAIDAIPDWLSCNVYSGRVYYGSAMKLLLTFNTDQVPVGSYSMNIIINSNDPLVPQTTIPVLLQVRNPLELSSFKALLQGMYNAGVMVPDTVTVQLRNTSPPYALVDQVNILLDQAGNGSGIFNNAAGGNTYYIVLKHRNAVETWSASGITSTLDSISYDFTSASGQAFGNNMVLKEGKWCIYSGDVDQDGLVGIGDLVLIFNDNLTGAAGFKSTDLNGDQFTEIDDLNLIFINKVLGIHKIAPAK